MVPIRRRSGIEAGIHLLVGFEGTALGPELKSCIENFRIGGIVLFRRNIESPEQLGEFLKETRSFAVSRLGRPLWVAVDQEGGPVQRLIPPFTQLPSAEDLGLQGPQAVAEWSLKAAVDLRRMGIHINLAPVLDVLPKGKEHFMEGRSLGSDPLEVSQLGRLWISTMQEAGISATAKHFPGLGSAELDPHHFAPVIRWQDDEAMRKDMLPFREAIKAGVHCVMTSHALYPRLDPEWPATLSPTISGEWLRNKLGFDGALLTDDLDMAAVLGKYSWESMVRQGLLSSVDFFLLCQRPENIEPFFSALVEGVGRASDLSDAHFESLKRIERLFGKHSFENGA